MPARIRQPLFGLLGRVYPKADWAPRVFRAKTTFEGMARSSVEAYFHSVIQTVNDYDLRVMNGEQGFVERAEAGARQSDDQLTVRFDQGAPFEQHRRRVVEPLQRLGQQRRALGPGAQDPRLLGAGPALVTDRLAGQVHHGVKSFERRGLDLLFGGVPADRLSHCIRTPRAHHRKHLVAGVAEAVHEHAADEPGRTGDRDVHGCGGTGHLSATLRHSARGRLRNTKNM